MAQLTQMRQRIQSVESIKKITQAMRLISMSNHSRLRHKKEHLETYSNAFHNLWQRISHLQNPEIQSESAEHYHLIVLVSSNKGLCGTFNTHLFKFFEQEHTIFDPTEQFISIGKYATDYLTQKALPLLATYNDFSSTQFIHIAKAITDIILANPGAYSALTLYANYPKTFFIQRPQKKAILPLNSHQADKIQVTEEYIFESSPEELNKLLYKLTLSISLQEILFESLLAEQAARFLSMDAASRNADNLIIQMRLDYNKARQATITREIAELSSSY